MGMEKGWIWEVLGKGKCVQNSPKSNLKQEAKEFLVLR